MNSRLRVFLYVIIGVVLVVGGLTAIFFAIRPTIIASLTPPTPEPQLKENVVVAARDLPLGTVLSASDLAVAEVPVENIPRNAIRDVNTAVGSFIKASMIEGEIILDHRLADPTNVNQDLAFILSDNHVLFALHPQDLVTTLAIIERGDIVEIFVSQSVEEIEINDEGEEESTTKLYTFDALQNVSVTAMVVEVTVVEEGGQSSNPLQNEEQEGNGQVVTTETEVQGYLLAIDPQDALVLKHLRDAGAIFDFALRVPTATNIFELDVVNEEYIDERYGLGLAP